MNIFKMSRVDERTGGCLLPVRFQSALNSSLTQRRPFCGRRDVLPVSILREACCQPRENLFRQPSLTVWIWRGLPATARRRVLSQCGREGPFGAPA
jgi:hypothetical protein